MLKRLVYCLFGPAFILLCACQDYDFKVNDKIVYAAIPLFTGYDTPDPGLKNCLQQAINDGAITAPEQLTTLDCSFAGITSLDGLAVFPALANLRLSANKVRNLVELNKMVTLVEVYLDDNQVIDPVPLYSLPLLRRVDLSGNPGLQCPRPGSFAQAVTVTLPQHCR